MIVVQNDGNTQVKKCLPRYVNNYFLYILHSYMINLIKHIYIRKDTGKLMTNDITLQDKNCYEVCVSYSAKQANNLQLSFGCS